MIPFKIVARDDVPFAVKLNGADELAPLLNEAGIFAEQSATSAAQSLAGAAAASSASATAIQARDAILDIIAASSTFATYAEANAAIAAIADQAFVQVLRDETRNQHWTIYRKVSGALEFILDRDAGAFVTLEQFGAVADCNPTTGTGTPSDDAMEAAIAALYLAGGGELRALGRYLFTQSFLVPNANTEAAIGTQPSIRIVGQGCSMNGGKGNRWIAKTIFYWTGEGGDAVAKIDTRGIGALTCLDLDFGSSAAASTKPFFHTTFTALLADRCGFVTNQTGPDCTQDAFVFGGTVDFETMPLFDRRSADCGFQGYGTAVTHCFFNGIRRVAQFRRYANDINFSFNNIWGACGNSSEKGCAIEADGGDTFCVGNNVIGNLFEMFAYKTAIDVDWGNAWKIIGNSAYDASEDYTETVVRVRENCAETMLVIGGLNNPRAPGDVYRPYLDDPFGKVKAFISNYGPETSALGSIKAGDDLAQNELGRTFFRSAGDFPSTVQPDTPAVDTASVWEVRRSADEGDARPNELVYRITYGGGLELNGAKAGDIRNGNSVGASWYDSGRSWGFNIDDSDPDRRSGATMRIDTGTGGSFLDLKAFQVRYYSHTGSQTVTVQNASGSIDITGAYKVGDTQVVGSRLGAVSDPSGTTGEELAGKIIDILSRLRTHGLIAS